MAHEGTGATALRSADWLTACMSDERQRGIAQFQMPSESSCCGQRVWLRRCRCARLVDVPGEKLPSAATGALQEYLRSRIAPQVPSPPPPSLPLADWSADMAQNTCFYQASVSRLRLLDDRSRALRIREVKFGNVRHLVNCICRQHHSHRCSTLSA